MHQAWPPKNEKLNTNQQIVIGGIKIDVVTQDHRRLFNARVIVQSDEMGALLHLSSMCSTVVFDTKLSEEDCIQETLGLFSMVTPSPSSFCRSVEASLPDAERGNVSDPCVRAAGCSLRRG